MTTVLPENGPEALTGNEGAAWTTTGYGVVLAGYFGHSPVSLCGRLAGRAAARLHEAADGRTLLVVGYPASDRCPPAG